MSLGNNMILASGAVIEPENVSIPVLTPRDETFTMTVVNSGGNKFYANGQNSLYVELYQGFTYKFDQSDASNTGHPLVFSTTEDGSNYTDGVSSSGTPGQAGAYTQIVVANNAPSTLWIKCNNHTGMGFSTPVNAYNNILYTTDGAWNTSGDFTYQWQRGGGSSWSNIGGATSNSYTLTSSDNGEFVRCAVTLTNDAGTATAFTNTSNVKAGQETWTQTSGTYSWTCPGGVTSVSIMAIGKGGNGYSACNNVTSGTGGRGGALSYTNNYSVTPGTTYYIHIQAYQGAPHYANISGFSTSSTNNNTNAFVVAAQPGENGTGGGDQSKGFGNTKYSGGTCYGNQGGGGGASGYSGNGGSQPSGTNQSGGAGSGGGGGSAATVPSYASGGAGSGPGGGGVGYLGEGTSGAGGVYDSSSTSDRYGGGGGGSGASDAGNIAYQYTGSATPGTANGGGGGGGGAWYGWGPCSGASSGAHGAIRILYPGNTRSYPSTNTGDM